MVPEAGVEPARGCPLGILSPVRLPIPPLGHEFRKSFGGIKVLKVYIQIYQIFIGLSTIAARMKKTSRQDATAHLMSLTKIMSLI